MTSRSRPGFLWAADAFDLARKAKRMKNYTAIVRDHSGSMHGLASAAMKDFNDLVDVIQASPVPTRVSVVELGIGAYSDVRVVQDKVPQSLLQKLKNYHAESFTPLLDAIGAAIESLEKGEDADLSTASMLVNIITDGDENHSKKWTWERLRKRIKELTATGRWTFVVRSPNGSGRYLTQNLGLEAGNVLDWKTTNEGLRASSVANLGSTQSYYAEVAKGKTATRAFFAKAGDLDEVAHQEDGGSQRRLLSLGSGLRVGVHRSLLGEVPSHQGP
jgi:hypothetical protein